MAAKPMPIWKPRVLTRDELWDQYINSPIGTTEAREALAKYKDADPSLELTEEDDDQ